MMDHTERFLSSEQAKLFARCAALLGIDPGPPGIKIRWEDVDDPYDTDEDQ